MNLRRFVPGMILLAASSTAWAQSSSKYALLVGVAKYEHAAMNPLEFPEADAKALGELLKAGGYDVDVLLGSNATRKAIREKLDSLNQRGAANGVVLISLSGHGVEVVARNSKNQPVLDDEGNEVTEGCFCPFDTSVRLVRDKNGDPILKGNGNPITEPDSGTLITLAYLMTSLKVAKSRSRVVFADCCRETPNKTRGRSFGASFEASKLPKNTSVLFGCSPQEMAYEHKDWGHGAFTKCLLDELPRLSSQGRVTTGTLIDRLQQSVPELVATVSPRDVQTPVPFFTNTIDLQLSKLLPNFTGKNVGDAKELVSGIKFRWCPPDKFTMGSPVGEKDHIDNEAQVSVTLTRGFWMGETELTQGQWESVMQTTPWKGKDYVKEEDAYPAAYISYDDAIEFCRRLTDRERVAGRLPSGWKYTLPTEAQWEYACRAGSKSIYNFEGDEDRLGEYAWFDESSVDIGENYAHIVGLKKGNAWGLKDMHGNVWEYCSDWYAEKLEGGSDPSGPSSGSLRVLRGGDWSGNAAFCRSASRRWYAHLIRGSIFGFRVAAVQDTI